MKRSPLYWLRQRPWIALAILVTLMLLARCGWSALHEPSLLPLPVDRTVGVVHGADVWPAVGGDLGGTHATAARVYLNGEALWSARLPTPPAAPAVVDSDHLYVPLDDGRLITLNRSDGTPAWEVTFANALSASPTAAGRSLWVVERSGRVSALDAETGATRWQHETGSLLLTPVLVAQGTVYAFGHNGVFGIDAATGERLWSVEVDADWGEVPPPMALSGEYILLVMRDRALVLDRAHGHRTYWHGFALGQPITSSIANGIGYVGSRRAIVAFELASERPWWDGLRRTWERLALWKMAPTPPPPPRKWIGSTRPGGLPASIGDGAIFLGYRDGRVDARTLTDGAPRWSIEGPELVAPPVLSASGLLVVGKDEARVLDPQTGATLEARAFGEPILRRAVATSSATYIFTEDAVLAFR